MSVSRRMVVELWGKCEKEGELLVTVAAINEIFHEIYVKLTMMFHRIVPAQRR